MHARRRTTATTPRSRSGLSPGELVVVDGADKLRAGRAVDAAARRPTTTPEQAGRMNPSRPFILRPVATSLLMVAILLAGAVAYRQLPVSALPQVDYPTIQVRHVLSRRQPRRDGVVGDRAARAPVRPDAGPDADDVDQLERQLADHAAVQPRPRASTSPSRRCRRRSTPPSPSCRSDLPNPPIYSKTNPADAPILTLALTSDDPAAAEGRGPGRHAPGAEDRPAAGRRPGQHQRRPAPGGAHPGQPDGARRLRPDASRTCAPPSPPPTSTRPRAASTARARRTRSAPTTSCCPAPTTGR